ncbi:MAG TPA: 50S ribosomal protein L10 [Bacteroidetes bacterium]|nr:50S ribosomal protein L10 [Bacteroidota bacterium]
MTREEKNAIIDQLTERINTYGHLYIADISTMNASETSDLRRKCFEKEIKLIVVKNTLLKKALENAEKDYSPLFEVLKYPSSIMLSDTANLPAKLIKEFRKSHEKPILKAAFVEESVYIGDEQLDVLASLKSKEELIGDIIMLLQSPMKNVLSALQSGNNILTGVLQTLSEKEN